jgi:hypothetical protein
MVNVVIIGTGFIGNAHVRGAYLVHKAPHLQRRQKELVPYVLHPDRNAHGPGMLCKLADRFLRTFVRHVVGHNPGRKRRSHITGDHQYGVRAQNRGRIQLLFHNVLCVAGYFFIVAHQIISPQVPCAHA